MARTTFSTVAFLSYSGHAHPTLEIKGEIPKEYSKITIKGYTFGNIVEPDGFDDEGRPYFSDEFYQKLGDKYNEVIKFDKERARNLFWFDVRYEFDWPNSYTILSKKTNDLSNE